MDYSIERDLYIPGKWMNAAGFLGFSPPTEWPWGEIPGVFVTHPVSYAPRFPADDRGLISFDGGFLLHSGWPNPGFRQVLHHNLPRWERTNLSIWVHLLGEDPIHLERMVRRLEEIENVTAVELSVAPQVQAGEIFEQISSVSGELPVNLVISLDRARESWVEKAIERGISAVTLAAPRGMVYDRRGLWRTGRVYGRALFAQMMAVLKDWIKFPVPVIASGGIFSKQAMEQACRLGAAAVQLDAVLWRGELPEVET